jgi:HEPN domain-containing protein
MPNKTYAKEWLQFSYKNLATAKLLFEVNHYEDIIGVDIQQALEKMIKAMFAYNNIKIPKEHDLVKLYYLIDEIINLEEDAILKLRIATNYYKEDRYPNPNYELPAYKEIKEVLDFAHKLFLRVCELLEIDMDEIIDAR